MTTVSDEPFPKLKDFTFERKLGSGTYASVYKAINKNKNNEVCAVKCIKRSSLNESSTENLLREIEILKNIQNDYIVQLKDFQWNENYIYLIMEFCAGGDLSNFIRSRRTIPEKYVRRFLQQIASALKHLHSLGIAHMDLKPQNILLTSVNNPSLKLGDFGFAQNLKENSVGKSLRGSPLYMAPEILKYKRYNAKVDLWSVGVILYEVIFGYAPFVSNSFEELEIKILDNKPIEIPSNVMLSETCKDLLKRLLQRDPNCRISFDQFFNHPFIDLDHMPDANSYNKARNLFEKAIQADDEHDYFFAQKCYLNALEYLIPAIQYENDNNKKEAMRAKATRFLKRAEELSNIKNRKLERNTNSSTLSRPCSSATLNSGTQIPITIVRVPSATNASIRSPLPSNNTDINLSTIKSISDNQATLIEALKEACSHDSNAIHAIQLCLQSDSKVKNGEDTDDVLANYQTAISHLLPFLKTLPKESDASKILKKQIDRWLSYAEALKDRLEIRSKMNKLDIGQAEENLKDEDNSSLKQCILQ